METETNRCPATGRSATACIDATHTACWAGRAESVALDLRVNNAHRAADPTY